MALIDKKILESERNSVYVKGTEGDRLLGTVVENKNVFDRYPELIRGKFNELIDLLITCGLDTLVTDLSDRYTKTETDELVDSETGFLVADVSIDLTTGAITITKKDGTSQVIDTALEKVPATFEFVEDTAGDKFYLKVTNVDGTSTQTEVTNLMNQYTFQPGNTVTFTVTKSGTTTTVKADILAKSITLAMLADEVTAFINESVSSMSSDRAAVEAAKTEVLNASQTVTSNAALTVTARDTAVQYSNTAKSYAVGGTGTRNGEDADNAKEYARQAALSAQQALNYKNEAGAIVGGDFVTDAELRSAMAGKANKPSTVTSVISAVGWKGNVYSFEDIYPSDMYRVSIEPDNTCTADEISAWGMALMTGSATTNVLTALGDVPTVDIPVILTVTVVSSDNEPALEITTNDTGYYLDTGTNTYNLSNVVKDESQLDGTNYNFDIL